MADNGIYKLLDNLRAINETDVVEDLANEAVNNETFVVQANWKGKDINSYEVFGDIPYIKRAYGAEESEGSGWSNKTKTGNVYYHVPSIELARQLKQQLEQRMKQIRLPGKVNIHLANTSGSVIMHNEKDIVEDRESVQTNESMIDSMEQVVDGLDKDVAEFLEGGDMSEALYNRAYEYYSMSGDMPYGTANARDGDPHEWVSMRLEQDLPDYVDVGSSAEEKEYGKDPFSLSHDDAEKAYGKDPFSLPHDEAEQKFGKDPMGRWHGRNESVEEDISEDPTSLEQVVAGLEDDVATLMSSGELSDELYNKAFSYYMQQGTIPYGTAKARDGDPIQWVTNRLHQDLRKSDNSVNETMKKTNPALDDMLKLSGLYKPVNESVDKEESDTEWANSPSEKYYDSDLMINTLSGGPNANHTQVNPNNPGDNPLAMGSVKMNMEKLSLNLKEETEKIEKSLRARFNEAKKKVKPYNDGTGDIIGMEKVKIKKNDSKCPSCKQLISTHNGLQCPDKKKAQEKVKEKNPKAPTDTKKAK